MQYPPPQSQCLYTFSIVVGTTPRWYILSEIINPLLDPNTTSGVPAITITLNSTQEAAIGVGRTWPFPPIEGAACILSASIVRQIDIPEETAVGTSIDMRIRVNDLLSIIGSDDTVDTDALGSTDQNALAELLFPNLNETRNDIITVNTREVAGNTTVNLADIFGDQPTVSVGNVSVTFANQTFSTENSTALAIQLEDLLGGFGINVTIPRDVNLTFTTTVNGTITVNELFDALNLTDAQTTFNTTIGQFVDTVLPTVAAGLEPIISLEIAGVLSEPDGKYPSALGSAMIWEQELAFRVLTDQVLALLSGIDTLRDNVDSLGLDEDTTSTLEDTLQPTDTFNSTAIQETFRTLRETDYTIQSLIQFRDRLDIYVSSLKEMTTSVARYTDQASERIGPKYPATFLVPIATSLEETIFVRYFLENVFGAVIALLVLLGVLLIYSLLLNDVEGKTYEYGMLRALGMKQRTLVQILGLKSFLFAICGIGTGLFFCWLVNIPVAELIAEFAAVSPDYELDTVAVVIAAIVGLVMPLVSNIFPIRRALTKTLRDSLDVYHHVADEVSITVVKLSQLGLSPAETVLAILLIVVGFVTFYIVPYAFTFRDFKLFLSVLNAILLGMLLGLAILASAFQPYVERAVLWCLMWGSHMRLHGVVRKNLSGHRQRNGKTSQMFTICLAFIIFAGVMFELQTASITDQIKVFLGADITVIAPDTSEALDEAGISGFLDREMQRTRDGIPNAVVLGYTFITFNLFNLEPITRTRFSNLPQFPRARQFIYGLQPNYLGVTYSQFYFPTKWSDGLNYPTAPNGEPDVIQMMFADAGNARLPLEGASIRVPINIASGSYGKLSDRVENYGEQFPVPNANLTPAYTEYIDVVASEALTEFSSVSLETPLSFRIRRTIPGVSESNIDYLAKARGFVRKVPGFFYSSYRQTIRLQSALMREEQYAKIVRDADEYAGTSSLVQGKAPKQRVMIQITENASSRQRDDLINGLRTYLASDATQSIDVRSVVESTESATELLTLFFLIVGIIALSMCFFILWLSFIANVRENAWEFGVLRAIGLNSTQLIMVYVYEALALVLSSVLIGASVGILISISLTLQFNLFTEMPFQFRFPYLLFFSMSGMAALVAVLGSALPVISFLRKSISNIIRRQ
jgi:ABC-type antimicrobial peptide transport system permease subunit